MFRGTLVSQAAQDGHLEVVRALETGPAEQAAEEIVEEAIRKEGWTKHVGRNGKNYWAVIGKPELSTWTQPRPGDLARKLRELDGKAADESDDDWG